MVIIKDTREKDGWDFSHEEKCEKMIVSKLDTGDYSLASLEDKFTIERKASVSEFANNCTDKRFKDVLLRMSKLPHAFILLEFSWTDVSLYPVGSNIPRNKWESVRVKLPYIKKCVSQIMVKYGIHIMFCDNKMIAEQVAFSIIKSIYENYK